MWPHLFRYNLKKLLDHHQKDFNGELLQFKKPVSRQCFEVYLISFAPLYRILFVLCSLLALATSGYFYCCCILYVFLKSDVLPQVVTAVRRSGRSPKVYVYVCSDTCILYYKYCLLIMFRRSILDNVPFSKDCGSCVISVTLCLLTVIRPYQAKT